MRKNRQERIMIMTTLMPVWYHWEERHSMYLIIAVKSLQMAAAMLFSFRPYEDNSHRKQPRQFAMP